MIFNEINKSFIETINKKDLSGDVSAVNQIPIVPRLLDVISQITGTGFTAIARVTEDRWITCASKDTISFGLKAGDELEIQNTLCNEVRQTRNPIFIDDVTTDAIFSSHPIPPKFDIKSYVSFPIYRKDGTFFGTLCAIDKKPARVNTEEIRGTFELFADLISFHLDAVEEMTSTAEKLREEQELAELRDQFIAILGHDLKNPIATMRMSSDILLKMSKEDLTLRHAGLIKSTSYRMQSLIDNILDFARGRMGEGLVLDRQYNNGTLKTIIEQVVKEIRNNSPEREILVDFSLDHDVYCDKNRIGQLLSNLLSNADQHGDPTSPVHVKAITNGKDFKLSVSNSGKKIPNKSLEQLFQPFYKESKDENKKGLGLGLYIASEIAKAHDGELKVTSTEKETCFTLQIPLDKEN